jgi:hypothetical protein
MFALGGWKWHGHLARDWEHGQDAHATGEITGGTPVPRG